ncbi:MAG: glycosyltransferase WbuB, partial [Bacteroidota bacterium]
MEPKTIWFISKYYASPPNEGSGSTRVFQTMREMVKLGNKVIIFTSSVDPYAELDTNTGFTVSRTFEGVKFWLLSGIKYASSISLLRIISWIHFELVLFRDYAKEKTIPDIVIVSSPSILTIFNGLYLKRKYKAKLIFEVRDIWPLTLIEDAGMSRW